MKMLSSEMKGSGPIICRNIKWIIRMVRYDAMPSPKDITPIWNARSFLVFLISEIHFLGCRSDR